MHPTLGFQSFQNDPIPSSEQSVLEELLHSACSASSRNFYILASQTRHKFCHGGALCFCIYLPCSHRCPARSLHASITVVAQMHPINDIPAVLDPVDSQVLSISHTAKFSYSHVSNSSPILSRKSTLLPGLCSCFSSTLRFAHSRPD